MSSITTLALTCSAGTESLVKDEIKRAGYRYEEVYDRIVFMTGDRESIIRMNLLSRFAHRVHLQVGRFPAGDFDVLFEGVRAIPWHTYLPLGIRVVVDAVSLRSSLTSLPALQSIGKKAIVDHFGRLAESAETGEFHILLFLRDNICSVFVDTSGIPLHKRGYRRENGGDAPLKESLASALVALSRWTGTTPFWDVCTGSGTIAIEAVLLARGIPPGIHRSFAFERFGWFKASDVETERRRLRELVRTDTLPPIRATDRDTRCIENARLHAREAGVERDIVFEVREICTYTTDTPLSGTLVSNPPYGLRLTDPRLDETYRDIATVFTQSPDLRGGIITSYTGWENHICLSEWKKRKLYNGAERCDFYCRF